MFLFRRHLTSRSQTAAARKLSGGARRRRRSSRRAGQTKKRPEASIAEVHYRDRQADERCRATLRCRCLLPSRRASRANNLFYLRAHYFDKKQYAFRNIMVTRVSALRKAANATL